MFVCSSIKLLIMSLVRQNFHEECEAGVNKQVNLELYASYVYLSMASHFDRDDVALHGFAKFFRESSKEEREHAELLMKFQNQRGGRMVLQDIKKPERDEWGSGLEAMQTALDLEKHVNQALLDLHKVADRHGDAQFSDFIEGHFLTEQVEGIKKIGEYITNLKRVGPGLGEYMFDKEHLSE
nr:ferritin-like protein 1 [Phoronopsis harmeri]